MLTDEFSAWSLHSCALPLDHPGGDKLPPLRSAAHRSLSSRHSIRASGTSRPLTPASSHILPRHMDPKTGQSHSYLCTNSSINYMKSPRRSPRRSPFGASSTGSFTHICGKHMTKLLPDDKHKQRHYLESAGYSVRHAQDKINDLLNVLNNKPPKHLHTLHPDKEKNSPTKVTSKECITPTTKFSKVEKGRPVHLPSLNLVPSSPTKRGPESPTKPVPSIKDQTKDTVSTPPRNSLLASTAVKNDDVINNLLGRLNKKQKSASKRRVSLVENTDRKRSKPPKGDLPSG